MYKLNHFTDNEPKEVRSYFPSCEWSGYTHFSVADTNTGEVSASCGYFQKIDTPLLGCGYSQNFEHKAWEVEDYKHAAACIEQAQLYANAPQMFDILARLIAYNEVQTSEVKEVLSKITDISEAATRLLGEGAMIVIQTAK